MGITGSQLKFGFSEAPVEDPELPDLPTAEGLGRCDWKDPGDETFALLSLLLRLCTGPPGNKLFRNFQINPSRELKQKDRITSPLEVWFW